MLPQVVVDITNELRTHTLETEALVVGVDGNIGYILQVDGEGIVTHHSDINFAAIGIGSGHAKSYLMFSRYERLTAYFRALPILYRAKRQAEVAPGVGTETDYYFINKATGVTRVPEQFINVIAEHYKEEENRRARDIEIIEKKLADTMAAISATLNLAPPTSTTSSAGAVSGEPEQSGPIPQPEAPTDGKPA